MTNKKRRANLHEVFSNDNFRARRALFTYLIIAFGLGSIVMLGAMAIGEVAKTAVQALEGIVMVSLVSYLGVSAVDRAGILERVIQRPEERQPTWTGNMQQPQYPPRFTPTGQSGMVPPRPIQPSPLPDLGEVGSSTGR